MERRTSCDSRMKLHGHEYTDLHGVEAEFVIEEWTGDSEHKTG